MSSWTETIDRYNGVSVNAGELNVKDFGSFLRERCEVWLQEQKRGVWLTIPIERSAWIHKAVEESFVFHHAEKTHVVMTRWLPDEPDPLPSNASHQVGVGAFVVAPTGRLVLVKEKYGGTTWKVPTGIVEAHENIADAAVRECREETGLAATFEKVVAVRHSHAAPFGKSDIFFLCILRVDKERDLVEQPQEIARARWASYDDFLEQEPVPRDWPVWEMLYRLCRNEGGEPGDVDGLRHREFHSDNGRPNTVVYSSSSSSSASCFTS